MQDNSPEAELAKLATKEAEFRTILGRIVRGFVASEEVNVKATDETRARIIASLADETRSSAMATDCLVKERLIGDAATSARRAFEHAITAAWMANEKQAIPAYAREKGLRATRALLESVQKTSIVIPLETLAVIETDVPARSDIDRELKQFANVCDRFNAKLYVLYRMLCRQAHPSGITPVPMFAESDDERREIEIANAQMAVLALHTASASLIWASRALDKFTTGQPDKPWLKSVARELGVTAVLHLDMPDRGHWPI